MRRSRTSVRSLTRAAPIPFPLCGATLHGRYGLRFRPAFRTGVAPRCPDRSSSTCAIALGSGSRGARIHTSCAVVSAPTFDRAFARWCFTVECDRPRRWAAAFSDPGNEDPGDHPDLTVCGATAGAGRPSRHALRTRSQGSGGSARRMVIGRSLLAGQCVSPRPEPPHRGACSDEGAPR
jgi:hypothetical protein